MPGWAIDLGNTHTRVAQFDPESGSPRLLELPAICRAPGGGGPEGAPVIVPLNEANPTLGELDPAHSPREKRARLEISFGVDAERWLRTTVHDLKTRKVLLDQEPVVRLL